MTANTTDNTMHVIVFNAEKFTEEVIPNELESMQAIVGGYIETAPIGDGFLAVCNEEGMLLNLPRNPLGFYGNCFICRIDENNPGEFRGLTQDELARCAHALELLY